MYVAPMQTYKRHERSREAIELAYDSILQEKMKVRHKYGFQPPRRGRKTDLEGDPLVRPFCLPYSAHYELSACSTSSIDIGSDSLQIANSMSMKITLGCTYNVCGD